MTHATLQSRFHNVDASRVLAQAGAIAVNVALLMVLLTPVVPPLVEAVLTDRTDIIWVTPPKLQPVQPPTPVEKMKVEPKRAPTPRPVPLQAPQIEQPPVLVEQGEYVDPATLETVTDEGPTTPTIEPAQPQTGASLRYAIAPPPPYPREALRDGVSGTVTLEVLVDVDGRPLEVHIARSSGNRALDTAAKRHVLAKWRFEPAVRDGRAVQAIGLVPVDFVLTR